MGLFSFVGSLLGAGSAKKASKKAETAQLAFLEKGLAEQTRQYDLSRSDYKPYLDAGVEGVQGYGNLLGTNGVDAQASEIDQLKASPFYKSLYSNGEEAILQNGAATGGLRGGNMQRGLADFGRDTLSATIQQQLAAYGGLAGLGQGSTDAIAQIGANAANQRTNLYGQQGQVRAGGILTRGGINAQNWNNTGSFIEDSLKSLLTGGKGGGSIFG